jgi:predicted nucleotide-binding protein (sugar kinase/HSP70/actin superfamily)
VRNLWGQTKRERMTRGFERGGAEVMEKRRRFRIAMPRVLNMYSTGPFFKTYFEVLGLDPRNVQFSDETSEEMWQEGGKYGSVDPCFPAKVVQAHFHQLFFHKHKEHPLDVIFFPILTHVPCFIKHAVDHASCPIVAGTPDVMKAAFTKEQDYFATRGITYLDPSLSFSEPVRLKQRMFETFKDILQLTADESNFAADQAFAALERFDLEVQARGKAILEQVERENRLAILLIGRPYHLDPGLHHGIPEEFQAQGYPILSIRSIPKDEEWLHRFYAVHKARPFFGDLTKFMSEGPCVVSVLEGDNAIAKYREVLGATNPAEAFAGTVRKLYGTDIERNAAHGSDAPDTAAFEIGYFFSALELHAR